MAFKVFEKIWIWYFILKQTQIIFAKSNPSLNTNALLSILKKHISGNTIQICTEFKCVCDQFWVFMDNFEDIDQIN